MTKPWPSSQTERDYAVLKAEQGKLEEGSDLTSVQVLFHFSIPSALAVTWYEIDLATMIGLMSHLRWNSVLSQFLENSWQM